MFGTQIRLCKKHSGHEFSSLKKYVEYDSYLTFPSPMECT